ncbi:MAG: haloacid dehalogenase-like hydrolase, partial [Eubacteriales bacterium]|nr:haloacid dehalogenase-like hydrolase [Eubacteriales bacterium]
DIIISASPEFLLKPICEKLGIKYLIASKVDKKTGKYEGLNCYGAEKVIRLNKEMPNTEIREFYSDSFSDEPLAELADKSYIVLGEELFDWWEYKAQNFKK